MKNLIDHRVLGPRYDLFSFFEHEGPGLPVWLPGGLKMKNALIHYWRGLHQEGGYQEIESPMMLAKELWQRSGHCDYFEENMYFSSVDKRDYAIKPMNCPGALLLFAAKRRYEHELPLRLSELGHVHRHEHSGALHGLMRVRSFVQDDAHIFCKKEQLLSEVEGVIALIEKIMNHCELKKYHFELSLRGGSKRYLGSDEDWEFAQEVLRQAVISSGHSVIEREGEAKFYGPSLDLHLEDVHGRSWQCSSVQLDFNLPGRFDLHYFDGAGERHIPYMLHRAIFGSLERFIGILLENFGKSLPLWMHPLPFQILSAKESSNAYAQEIAKALEGEGLSYEIDLSSERLAAKLKKAYRSFSREIIVVGEHERKSQSLKIRSPGLEQVREISFSHFKAQLENP